jgi:hypothetical protein
MKKKPKKKEKRLTKAQVTIMRHLMKPGVLEKLKERLGSDDLVD